MKSFLPTPPEPLLLLEPPSLPSSPPVCAPVYSPAYLLASCSWLPSALPPLAPLAWPPYSEPLPVSSGRAACSRPPPAESPLRLLWLDAWLAHPCSRFFHRLLRTHCSGCWGRISWLREECRHCKCSGYRCSRPDRILRPLRRTRARIVELQIPYVDNPRQSAQPP